MASCAKCGRHPIRKDKTGLYTCKRCGARPTMIHLDRSGIKAIGRGHDTFVSDPTGPSILADCTGPYSIIANWKGE